MKHSKIFSLILAAALVLAMALPVSVSAAGDATITVTPPGSLVLDAGDFEAYKLFDVLVSMNGATKNYAYTPYGGTPDLITQFLARTDMATKYGTTWRIFRDNLQANSIDLTELTKDLKDSELFTPISGAKVGSNVEFSNLDYGYYLVYGEGRANYDSTANPSEMAVAHSALITVDSLAKNGTINLKADAPSITKDVWNSNATADWDNMADANIGDIMKFRLTSRVPVMTGYKAYTFTVHDTMSAGLTFDPASVEVTIGSDEINNAAEDGPFYAVVTGDDDPTIAPDTFQIVFDADWFVTLNPRANSDVEDSGDYDISIVITYEAELNENAVTGVSGNSNKAKLEYSNDPYNGGTGETPEDEVFVYTFDLDILKYDGNTGPSAPLAGAEFVLRVKDGADVVVVYVSDGNYRLATSEDAAPTEPVILTSGSNGKIHIDGLEAGVYELEETKAPQGYNFVPGIITEITITHTNSKGAYTVSVDGTTVDIVNIENNSGTILPGTGGIGRTIFYAASAVITFGLIGLIGFLAIRKRRNLIAAN